MGPGTYEPKRIIGEEGMKSTMGSKFNEFGLTHSRNLPGPGQYEVSRTTKNVMKQLPSYKIGTAQRPTSSQVRQS